MASKRKKTTPVRGILIFIVIVAISGYALVATKHFDSPFAEISDTVAMGNLIDGQFGADAASLTSSDTTVDTGTAKPSFDSLLAQDTSTVSTVDGAGIGSTSDSSITLTSSDTFSASALDAGNGAAGHDENSIQWSQIGDVLFDLWFLCAATVFVIIMQQIVGFLIRGLKRRTPPAMAA
ncbi:MAG: hypothetical protein ABI690_22905 [Chloroflexota bacterium]